MKVQQMPLNVITMGQTKSDDINQMISKTYHFYLVMHIVYVTIEMWSH